MIDGLNGYIQAMPGENFLMFQMHELLTYLGQQRVVSNLVMAQHGMFGTSVQSPVDARQAISMLKKRTGPHEKIIRELRLSKHGIEVGEPLVGFQGVLTGAPIYVGEARDNGSAALWIEEK